MMRISQRSTTPSKDSFRADETLEMVLQQWNEMILFINNEVGLKSLKHHDLSVRMLLFYAEEYSLALRLVAISVIVPCDTSECERIFSLLNDMKTDERSKMGARTLRNLMIWHRMARNLTEEGKIAKGHISCYSRTSTYRKWVMAAPSFSVRGTENGILAPSFSIRGTKNGGQF